MLRIIISIALCALILGGGYVIVAFAAAPDATTVEIPETGPAIAPANVEIEVLQADEVADILQVTGALAPWEATTLSAEVSGNVIWQGIEEGDVVEQGQVLVRVDTALLRQQVNQARTRAELAERELARAKGLQQRGVGTSQALDQAQSDYAIASAALRDAETMLEKSVLSAPFAGTVSRLHRKESEWADTGAPLLDLVQSDRLKAVVGIPEQDVVRFAKGDTVMIRHAAYPNRTFEGTIERIATVADAATRTFPTEIALDNADAALRPGMVVQADLVRDVFPNAVTVPMFAIRAMQNQRFVFVEQDGIAHMRPVELGSFHEARVHVTAGLEPGEHLIVVGQRDLRDGDPLNILDASAS